jgi:hypothetical protein
MRLQSAAVGCRDCVFCVEKMADTETEMDAKSKIRHPL